MGGTSKVLLGAVVAGMMSIDMGGPFNKAAYVFGTAALASGNYEVMAAVMVGGMVPPIAIALSTTFCPKKWTPDERRNGIVNYIMGLCFVTEGAIPYAAADPLRVLPSCVAGDVLCGSGGRQRRGCGHPEPAQEDPHRRMIRLFAPFSSINSQRPPSGRYRMGAFGV